MPALDHPLFGVVVIADEADDFVDMEIDDHQALEDLAAMRDRLAAEARTALQHLATMIEEGLERLLQIHHARHAVLVEDVEIEPDTGLEFGGAEQRFHQHRGLDIAALRL